MPEEASSEAHLPAERPSAGHAPRVPASHVDPGGPRGDQGSAPQGTPSAVGLIWRVRGRRTLAELRRRGRRVHAGPVTVTFVADDAPTPPRVAFAIGRVVGGAVVRNRLRRRLRAVLAELAADPGFRSGAYLVGAGPAAVSLTHEQLKASMARILSELDQRAGQS